MLTTPEFWRCYLVQMRPYLLFVSGVAGAAGMAMGAPSGMPVWKELVTFLPFFLGYGFGQALTDTWQTDTDAISAPYRPLSAGRISIRDVRVVSLTGLWISGMILFLLNPMNLLFSVLSVAGLASYSWVKRHLWYAAPFYNAWIVALLPVMGWYSSGGMGVTPEWGRLAPVMLMTLFSYANFVLIGYLKDIEADRATGYSTFPVVFGWKPTILVGDVFAAIALFLFWRGGPMNAEAMIAGSLATVIIIAGQVYGHATRRHDPVGAIIPITSTVRGFLLLHIAVVLQWKPGWWPLAILFQLAFEWALSKRPSREQV